MVTLMINSIFTNGACNLIKVRNKNELQLAKKKLIAEGKADALTFPLHVTYKNNNCFYAKTCFFSLSDNKLTLIKPEIKGDYEFPAEELNNLLAYYSLNKHNGYDLFYAILLHIFNNISESLKHIDAYTNIFNEKLREIQQKNIDNKGKVIGNSDISTKDEDFKNAFLIINKYKKTISDINYILVKEQERLSGHNSTLYSNLMSRVLIFEKRINFVIERLSFVESTFCNLLQISDASVIKIFTIMWTLYIPGTAIVNWYGQNFTRMPELSLNASWWVQVIALFVLTIIPLILIKNKGLLR
ncbi:magnesium transporter CorA family protein [Salmonella enterica subsp. enterica serovar Telelkebir]|nr:magnesium transporter CorA family protein [Salmonella enterica subsp. enterica serovar Telelkebir]ECU9605493.1 magnesium transporter CorA family protein [Salmonella enterica subsp. enterica serovar Telelkebir]